MNFIFQLIAYLVASYLSSALAPKPKVTHAQASTDYQAPTAEEGRPIPVVFGTVWIQGPNVVWYGDVASDPIFA